MTTLIVSFFRSLSLEHLERTLYSLSRQTVRPDKYLFFDNNTMFGMDSIFEQIDRYFPMNNWHIFIAKHGNDPKKTLAWAGNHSIHLCDTEVFWHTRADFLYPWDWCDRMMAAYEPMSFVGCNMFQMNYHEGVEREHYGTVDLERFNWRIDPASLLTNTEGSRFERNSHIDSPSFVSDKSAIKAAGGFDESLASWGHSQQDLQIQMARAGVKIKVVPDLICYHQDHGPMEGDARDKQKAMAEWQASSRRSEEEAKWMKANLNLI